MIHNPSQLTATMKLAFTCPSGFSSVRLAALAGASRGVPARSSADWPTRSRDGLCRCATVCDLRLELQRNSLAASKRNRCASGASGIGVSRTLSRNAEPESLADAAGSPRAARPSGRRAPAHAAAAAPLSALSLSRLPAARVPGRRPENWARAAPGPAPGASRRA